MPSLPQLKPKGTLADKTYEVLKRAIIDLSLLPGTLVTEENLSEQLGVSRTPIRTAINQLAFEGFIDVVSGKGTFVSPLSEKQLLDLLAVREALEVAAAKLAAKHRDDTDIAALRELLSGQQAIIAAAKGNDDAVRRFLELDRAFHKKLAELSRNTYLATQILQIMELVSRYANASIVTDGLAQIVTEHTAIFEGIRLGDEAKSAEALVAHTRELRNTYLKNYP